jgi:hypothetical protein
MAKDEIILCIQEMRLAEFMYKGSWRVVEPHLLGISNKGKLCLSAFQLSGGSGQSWRAFLVSDISGFVCSDEHFHETRPGFNPADSTVQTVIASV